MPSSGNNASASASLVPQPSVGIGLRAPHFDDVLTTRPSVAWLEIHAENYFGGGEPLRYLEAIREHYLLSVHCVGMSLGSVDPLNRAHIEHVNTLIERLQPGLVSDHLCWGSYAGEYFNDLLPLPYTRDTLDHVVDRVAEAQDLLGRQILVENVSSYLEFNDCEMTEWEFLNELAKRAGCGLLLDINNIYVSASNHGFEANEFLRSINPESVQEMHLAGFATNTIDGREILIDHHGAPVSEPVWELYEHACAHVPDTLTVVERDTNIPELSELVAEANRAARIYARHHALVA